MVAVLLASLTSFSCGVAEIINSTSKNLNMKHNMKWAAAVIAAASGLLAANTASADVTIETFDNFTANALYASWATPAATITPGATSWEVASIGYGSLWKYVGDINGTGQTKVQLTIDISGEPGFIAGPIVDLVDVHGAWGTYAWYGITTPGSYVLTADLSTTPWLDISDIQHIHLECDPGGAPTTLYDLTFKDLTLIPEPTSLTLLGLGAIGFVVARRRAQ
jgi:hypothetical protein